jgi:hypothetical protein
MSSWIINLLRRKRVRPTPPLEKPCIEMSCEGTMTFDDGEWPSYATWTCRRNADHREVVYGELRPPLPVKMCSVMGCGGTMICSDAHYPFVVKWLCDRDGVDHIQLMKPMKPCIVGGCHGTMYWRPHSGVWTCNDNPKHRQVEREPTPWEPPE